MQGPPSQEAPPTNAAPPPAAPATPEELPPPSGGNRWVSIGLILLLLTVAFWETAAGLWRRATTPGHADWAAAAAAVRGGFQPGDLIAITPPWADGLGRAELGDLMPESMVGRPDARPYRRIWELAVAGHRPRDGRGDDTAGLAADWQQRFGGIEVRRFPREPVAVPYDLVEHYLDAHVALQPLAGTASPLPCLFQGPPPAAKPAPGPAGAFRCPGSRVERRMLEIDYRPRWGLSVEVEGDKKTSLTWEGIPDGDWRSSQLVLWLGLHDYYARKNAKGPADVTVDLDGGAVRLPFRVELGGGLQQLVMALPPGAAGAGGGHAVRIEVSAASAPHHFVGVLGRLERVAR